MSETAATPTSTTRSTDDDTHLTIPSWLPPIAAAIAAGIALAIMLWGADTQEALGSAATWGAISAGLLGTTVALSALRQAQKQYKHSQQALTLSQQSLTESIAVARAAERDRAIEREIAIRRKAVDEVANLMHAVHGLRPYFDALVPILRHPETLEIKHSSDYEFNGALEVYSNLDQEGYLPSELFGELFTYLNGPLAAAELKAIATTNGTGLHQAVNIVTLRIHNIRSSTEDKIKHAVAGDIDRYEKSSYDQALKSYAYLVRGSADDLRLAIQEHATMDPYIIEQHINEQANRQEEIRRSQQTAGSQTLDNRTITT